jgi:hypothetical protein
MDKLYHFACCLMATLALGLVMPPLYAAIIAIVGLGMGKELYDRYVKCTFFSWTDVAADAVGAVVGFLLMALLFASCSVQRHTVGVTDVATRAHHTVLADTTHVSHVLETTDNIHTTIDHHVRLRVTEDFDPATGQLSQRITDVEGQLAADRLEIAALRAQRDSLQAARRDTSAIDQTAHTEHSSDTRTSTPWFSWFDLVLLAGAAAFALLRLRN